MLRKKDACVRQLWDQTLDIDKKFGRGRRACYAKRSYHERWKGLKHRWKFVCLQSVLSKPDSAFLHFVKSVVGNCQSDAVLIEVGERLKRSIQVVKSGSHPTVQVSLVVDGALSIQKRVSPLTRCESLLSFAQYEK